MPPSDPRILSPPVLVQEELPTLDSFKYRYYFTGSTSDLYALPGNPRPAANWPREKMRRLSFSICLPLYINEVLASVSKLPYTLHSCHLAGSALCARLSACDFQASSDYPFAFKCYKGCIWSEISGGKCTVASTGVSANYKAKALTGYTTQFAAYGTSGKNYAGNTYTSKFLSNGKCSSNGLGGSSSPTSSSTKAPTTLPTAAVTKAPTKAPTKATTRSPTKAGQTFAPTSSPTKASPTKAPTKCAHALPPTSPHPRAPIHLTLMATPRRAV